MKITYIHHSCFLVETDCSYYLFDYEQGVLPPLDTAKPIFVLVSHRHSDHYQPRIFSLLSGMQQVHPILSSDILPSSPCSGSYCNPIGSIPVSASVAPPLIVVPDREYRLGPEQLLRTFRSTDEGVAFLICDHGKQIYHAGDLNEWYWEGEDPVWNAQMVRDYRDQIDKLAQYLGGEQPDLAFIVLDPRQEADYARGILCFLQRIGAHTVFPMHYWDQPDIINQFLRTYPQYQSCIVNTEQYRHPSAPAVID